MLSELAQSPETLRLIVVAALVAFAAGCFAVLALIVRRAHRRRWLDRRLGFGGQTEDHPNIWKKRTR